MANFSYSKQVWQLVQNGSGQTDLLCQGITTNIKHWWNKLLETADNVDTIRQNQIITYTAWNIWKERYRSILTRQSRHNRLWMGLCRMYLYCPKWWQMKSLSSSLSPFR
jgi:hypothetical protein